MASLAGGAVNASLRLQVHFFTCSEASEVVEVLPPVTRGDDSAGFLGVHTRLVLVSARLNVCFANLASISGCNLLKCAAFRGRG